MNQMAKVFSAISKVFLYQVSLPLFILVAGVAASFFAMYQVMVKYPETFGLLKGPSIIRREEKALIAEIGKTLALPADEEPTIATVTEPEKLTGAFFRNAKKGDKIIIYQKSKKVFLYRPSEKRVVEVGIVNISQQDGQLQVENYRFAILNGTTDENATLALEAKLKEIASSSEITDKTTASRTDYQETIIVDVAKDKEEIVNRLAVDLGITVGQLPEGEIAPNADFVIIVGADQL